MLLLEFGGEDFGHIHLSQRLAQVVVDVLHAALPARLQLFRAAQVLAVELEIFLDELRRKIRRRRVGHMEAQIGFPAVDRFRGQQRVQFLDEFGSIDVEDGKLRILHLAVVGDPVEVGRKLDEIGDLHFVHQFVRDRGARRE